MVFYLRYSVGIMSLTLDGEKMSLREASKYSKEHDPAGLTRRYATYATCYLLAISLFRGVTGHFSLPSAINLRSIDYLATLGVIVIHLLFIIGMMALISGYLKNIPAEALEPQPEQSG